MLNDESRSEDRRNDALAEASVHGKSTPGVIRRLLTYFTETFPIALAMPAFAIEYLSFYTLVQVAERGTAQVGRDAIWGGASWFCFFLMLRLFDELKDEAVEAEYFPNRPLVTGRVLYSDVRALTLVVYLGLMLLNLDRGPATSGFLLFFGFAILSWQWWLFPKTVQPSFWLLAATHQTLAPLSYFYVYTVYLANTGQPLTLGVGTLLCLVYWPKLFAWEIARKCRAPEQETSYPSYSKKWGARRAGTIALSLTLLSSLGLLGTGAWLGFSTVFFAVSLAFTVVAGAMLLRYVLEPSPKTAHGRTILDLYTVCFTVLILGELQLRGLVRWG